MYYRRFLTGTIFLILVLITLIIDFISSTSTSKIFPIIILIEFLSLFFLNFTFYNATLFGGWKDLISTKGLSISKEKYKLILPDGQKIRGLIFFPRKPSSSPLEPLSSKTKTHEGQNKIPIENPIPKTLVSKLIIFHHGLTGSKWSLIHYAIPLTQIGYTTVVFDARGHGKSRKKGLFHRYGEWHKTPTSGIFPDFTQIIDDLAKKFDILSQSISVIGHSMGGAVVLSQGTPHPKVKRVIALDPFYSWRRVVDSRVKRKFFSEAWVQYYYLFLQSNFRKILKQDPFVSPEYKLNNPAIKHDLNKIRLIHSKTDPVLLYKEQFLPLQEYLKLDPSRYLVLNRGNHHLRGQETIVLAQIIQWL